MSGAGILAGRRLLVVEDDYLIVMQLEEDLVAAGVTVVGPAGGVAEALDLIQTGVAIDAAVLDLNLRGEMAYPIADALIARDIPFVFATGYDQSHIEARYAAVKRCEKPVEIARLGHALFG